MASGFPDWLRASALLGQHAGDYVVVAVTDAGQLYALLQGETVEGDIETVRLDEEGRISAFVIDSVDAWGRMLSIGNAELAARLGSPVIYEQAGRVQLIETFEQGLSQWLPSSSGAGADAVVTPTNYHHGGYSCKMTGGSNLECRMQISHSQGSFPRGKIGLAVAYSAPDPIDRIELELRVFDGVTRHYVRVKLDDVNNKLCIYDDTPAWQEVGVENIYTYFAYRFNFVKITADIVNDVYGELRFNQQEIDVSAYSLDTDLSNMPPRMDILLWVYSNPGDNDVVYFDDVILTVEEP